MSISVRGLLTILTELCRLPPWWSVSHYYPHRTLAAWGPTSINKGMTSQSIIPLSSPPSNGITPATPHNLTPSRTDHSSLSLSVAVFVCWKRAKGEGWVCYKEFGIKSSHVPHSCYCQNSLTDFYFGCDGEGEGGERRKYSGRG